MKALEIRGLTKNYPAFRLDNISFSVEEGEIMGFIGRNGAGKTTTLRSLFNLVHPDAGEIEFFGIPFSGHEDEIKQRTGFVSGGVDYYGKKKLSVITAVTKRFYTEWDEKAYEKYLKDFSLDESKTPEQLSAGMRVKYSLALALSHNAELLILDEPTSGLDPVSREELLDIFISLSGEGKTILFSTHITSDLEKCADSITYIKNGRIFLSEPLESFENKYVHLSFENEPPADIAARLTGLKRAKHGYTAVCEKDAALSLGLQGEPASLETVMVHIEKEGGGEVE